MRRAVVFGLAAAAMAAVGVADAAVSTLGKAGSWTASGGTTDAGKPICTMSSSGKGLWFGVKYFKGDTGLTVQISHDDWKLKDGLKVKTTMQFGKASPWSASAESFHMSDGDAALELEIPNKQIEAWIGEFAANTSMVLRFPDEKSIDDWRLDLTGADQIVKKFGTCINKM